MQSKAIFISVVVLFICPLIKTESRGNVTDIVFQLFTRRNPLVFQTLNPNDPENLRNSNFDKTKPVKMYIHGYNGEPDTGYGIKSEYLSREDVNVITVDWTALSSGLNYPGIALNNVPAAGDYVGAFIDYLIEEGTPISSFHLIGWSLGAHVAGNAGEAVTAGLLPRITGLDPAGPGYAWNDTDRRLDLTDAEFVDIIHTNAGSLLEGGVGFAESLGHADFFPNGGLRQPGCNLEEGNCSHRRCVQFFQESINSRIGFLATECDSWDNYLNGACQGNVPVKMGDQAPSNIIGDFFLETNPTAPFAIG